MCNDRGPPATSSPPSMPSPRQCARWPGRRRPGCAGATARCWPEPSQGGSSSPRSRDLAGFVWHTACLTSDPPTTAAMTATAPRACSDQSTAGARPPRHLPLKGAPGTRRQWTRGQTQRQGTSHGLSQPPKSPACTAEGGNWSGQPSEIARNTTSAQCPGSEVRHTVDQHLTNFRIDQDISKLLIPGRFSDSKVHYGACIRLWWTSEPPH